MSVAIIGTGRMGSALGRRFVKAGLEVTFGSRDLSKVAALEASLGNRVRAATWTEVARAADLLVLAVPFGAVAEVIEGLGDLSGKALVDITNPITPDYMALTIGHTTSAAEEIQKLSPSAKVVKAFNTIFADVLEADSRDAPTPQIFTASDDSAAEGKVAELIRAIGFRPVKAGPLINARYLEPLGELNIQMRYRFGHGNLIVPGWTGMRD